MKFLFVVLAFFGLTSCHSFYISLDSLKQQYSNIDSTSLTEAVIQAPYFKEKYLANPIRKLKCKDKKGVEINLEVSPSIEMEITSKNGMNTVFYMDRTMIYNNKLIGVQSRFPPFLKDEVPLDSIAVIRVQDGRKKFYYLKR